jgi:uncharacterized membrane protein
MPVHPMVVHFPLALIVTGALCLTAAWARPALRAAPTLAVVGTWNLGAGALCVILALGTGLGAVLDLHIGPAARAAVSLHAKWAVVTSCLVLLAAVWRTAGTASDSRPSTGFTLVLWAATGALIFTGFRGGQNVYVHGVGTAAIRAPAPEAR